LLVLLALLGREDLLGLADFLLKVGVHLAVHRCGLIGILVDDLIVFAEVFGVDERRDGLIALAADLAALVIVLAPTVARQVRPDLAHLLFLRVAEIQLALHPAAIANRPRGGLRPGANG